MIRDMNYIKTEKLKIQRNISDSSFKLLQKSISDCSQSIENKLENILYKNGSNLFKLDLEEECRKNNITKLKIIFETTSNFTEKCFKKLKFEHLLRSVPENILDFSSKQEFSNENRVLSFFTELVLTNPNQSISDDRVWLKIDLLSFTNQLVKNLKENLNNLLEKKELVFSSDLGQCQSKLKHISNQIEFSSNASSIFENFNGEIIKASLKQTLIKISNFRNFLNVSDEIKNQNIKLKLKEIIYKLDSTLQEISSSKNSVSSDEDQLYFKSNFSTLSVICSQINVDRNVKLKTINVFHKYSLEVDENCSISRVIYSTHVPDLVIITPKLFVKKTISINLSCESTPENFKEKAKDGSFFGENGHDGEPGKPGYNGGRLFIFAEYVKYANESKIEFISIGGNGGPGQDGGHGQDGRDGNKPRIIKRGEGCFKTMEGCSIRRRLRGRRSIEESIQNCINSLCTGIKFHSRINLEQGDNWYRDNYIYVYKEQGGDCTASGSFGYGGDGGQSGFNGYMSIQTKEYKYTSNYTELYGA
ncbi:hypothetical protein BpHYR1_041619 [Brachionus plicatilis]|uniref:Uncharacterized protein n=1 Tax=Brachionus plicatilis TaxID=10195 RepID=A0A3M7RGU3_BRAPC|nr:hypothetical protein BpHYR1_041619 [Brachionus plicatilis]